MGRLDGRVALVTGASRGFGRAIALAFAREGADVAVNYRASASNAAEVATAVQKLGRGALVVEADVASDRDVNELIGATLSRFGRLDILVNNAGIMERGVFADVPVSAYTRMFGTNVTGTMLCTRAALPAMIERRYGRIVNVSSQLARAGVGTGGFAAYAATKGAIEAFTRAVALEVGEHGITVNALAPGGIDTDMSRAVMTPEYRARRTKELAVRRLGTLDDVAYAALCLADDAAGYLTGQVLQINGGWVMS
ncbi:MAG TPA: glucose 1-dehydrogenase [Methylomirabilota bacterium]|jgi:NAD(P)-dependent dehydrogenase (short-subunit alcohol dehydrogenase family)|nr:glucose 1-dehydrogenase [Methylomirabilota bacterium]